MTEAPAWGASEERDKVLPTLEMRAGRRKVNMAGRPGTLPGEAGSRFIEVRSSWPISETEWENARVAGKMSVGAKIDTQFGWSRPEGLGGKGRVVEGPTFFPFLLSPCSFTLATAESAKNECAEVRAGVCWES